MVASAHALVSFVRLGYVLYIGKFVFSFDCVLCVWRSSCVHRRTTAWARTANESGRCFKLTRIFETPLIPIQPGTSRVCVCVSVFFFLLFSMSSSSSSRFWQIQYLLVATDICWCGLRASTGRCARIMFVYCAGRCCYCSRRSYMFRGEKIHGINVQFFVFIRGDI